jgi:hypothetical protein
MNDAKNRMDYLQQVSILISIYYGFAARDITQR